MNDVLERVKAGKIHANNTSSTEGPTLCFNFIEVPDTSGSILTVAILKDGFKRRALEPSDFSSVMRTIERSWDGYEVVAGRGMDSSWFRMLNCQRFFFIPTNLIFTIIRSLFTIQNMDEWWRHGVTEVTGMVKTESHSLKIDFGG